MRHLPRARPRRGQRGFTLTEVMVVLAIIGVLVTMALLYVQPKLKPFDVAVRVGDLAREASRRAVALGPVRADVALAVTRARTRLRATGSPTQPTFVLERLQEDALPASTASWIPVLQYTVDRHTLGESWGAGVGTHSGLTLSTNWSTFEAKCYPDGSCESRTLFFQADVAGAPIDQYARVSILPIGGAIRTLRYWN